MTKPSRSLLASWAALVAFGLVAAAPPPESGRGVVAADHALASAAGAEMLARGGNAVDAAVATALSAGVVQPAGSGLGGGGFAVVVLPSGAREILDFREVAPAAAHRDLYRTSDGGVDSKASRIGGLAVGVPGEPRGLAELLERWGTLSPRIVAGPAIEQATRGFRPGPHLASALARTELPAVRELFAIGDRMPGPADRIRRPELASTLRRWASSAGEDLYTGATARRIAAAVGEAEGILTAEDLASYAPKRREPIVGRYRGYTVITMPPPSSGGIALTQMLSVLEGYDVADLGHNSSDHVHLVVEVMKHAYADRAHHLGDPDFVEVPTERLLSEARVDEIRKAVWPGRTFGPEHYGELIEPPKDAGTQHVSVIDQAGAAVALTTTINTSFGSGVVVDDAGLILNNEMDDFAAAPGVPNAFGLIGGEANAVAAGKRPLSSMTPTVLLDEDGEVVMSVGASGGSFIISATLQVIQNVVDFGMDPQEAVSAPRFHHQWQPDTLFVEPGIPRDVITALEARGHEVTVRDGFTAVQIVVRDGEVGLGGSDPRKGGWPAGVW